MGSSLLPSSESFKKIRQQYLFGRDFRMARSLKIISFTSEDNAEPYEFEFTDDKSTILDVKKFIKRKEALVLGDEEVKLIKIFWLVVPLPDELLVKDLLDQKAEPELYV